MTAMQKEGKRNDLSRKHCVFIREEQIQMREIKFRGKRLDKVPLNGYCIKNCEVRTKLVSERSELDATNKR